MMRRISGYTLFFLSALAFFATPASAHIGVGEYAGTHLISFVPEPLSPYAGETVRLVFFVSDLHRKLIDEPLETEVVVQILTNGVTETELMKTTPKRIGVGEYAAAYRFAKPGHYRIEFLFWRAGEEDIVREAVFDVEARPMPPSRGTIALGALAAFLVGCAAGLLAGKKIRSRA